MRGTGAKVRYRTAGIVQCAAILKRPPITNFNHIRSSAAVGYTKTNEIHIHLADYAEPLAKAHRWAIELFKKLLDLLKNSVSFVSLWLSLHFCVCLVVLTVVTLLFFCYKEIIFIQIIQLIVCSFVERL